jgi:hypothetical protein
MMTGYRYLRIDPRRLIKSLMTEEKNTPHNLAAAFNSLSGIDKAKLKAAAVAGTLTDFIREDTKKHPWKFPLYAAYMATLVEPIPTGGVLLFFSIASAYAASRLPNPWSRRLKQRLDASLDKQAVAEKLREFIVPDPDKPQGWRVDNVKLAKSTLKQGLSDTRQSAESAYGSLQDFAVNDIGPTLKTAADASAKETRMAFGKAQDFATREIVPVLNTSGKQTVSAAKSLWSKVNNLWI